MDSAVSNKRLFPANIRTRRNNSIMKIDNSSKLVVRDLSHTLKLIFN